MLINQEEQIANINEPALQGPDNAEITDTDGISGSDEPEFETEQQQYEEAHKNIFDPNSSDELPEFDQQDESMHVSSSHDIGHEQDEANNKSNKADNKLSQEDIDFFLENEVIEKALKLSQEDEKNLMPALICHLIVMLMHTDSTMNMHLS